jgi:histidine triad (HIT) family protein
MDCLFCKIIKGEISAHKVYEDDNVLCFLDIYPHAKGHTVVIPKKHYENFLDMPDSEMGHFWQVVKKVTGLLKDKLKADGFNVGLNGGEMAGQAVPHLHVHIFPRFEGDGGGSFHSVIKNPGEEKLEDILKEIIQK